jgi:hypothetical protein
MKSWFYPMVFLAGSFAYGDTFFSCVGNTYDGNTITIEGSYNMNLNRMITGLTVTQSLNVSPSTSWKQPALRPHFFPARSVVISPTNDYWTLSAQAGGEQIIIRHPDSIEDETYMRVYLGPTFDHEFNHATCTFE